MVRRPAGGAVGFGRWLLAPLFGCALPLRCPCRSACWHRLHIGGALDCGQNTGREPRASHKSIPAAYNAAVLTARTGIAGFIIFIVVRRPFGA